MCYFRMRRYNIWLLRRSPVVVWRAATNFPPVTTRLLFANIALVIEGEWHAAVFLVEKRSVFGRRPRHVEHRFWLWDKVFAHLFLNSSAQLSNDEDLSRCWRVWRSSTSPCKRESCIRKPLRFQCVPMIIYTDLESTSWVTILPHFVSTGCWLKVLGRATKLLLLIYPLWHEAHCRHMRTETQLDWRLLNADMYLGWRTSVERPDFYWVFRLFK